MNTARILGHRGAMALYPENTIRSVLGALRGPHPADGVEFDVRLTSDGSPVIFHDDETERLTGSPGTVEERDLAALASLSVAGEPIPTLVSLGDVLMAEADASRRELLVNAELKPTGDPAPLVRACLEILNRLDQHPRIELVVSSFDPTVLKAASGAGLNWRLALLYEQAEALAFLPHLELGRPLDLHPRSDLVSSEHMALVGGRTVRTWTVDEPEVARSCIDLGVTAIISNDPGALGKALAAEAANGT